MPPAALTVADVFRRYGDAFRSRSGPPSRRRRTRSSRRLRFAGRLQPLTDPRRFAEHLRPAGETEWVVYAKPPFAGPEQVLDYLGRYTHRIAIGDQRLCSLRDGAVRFRYTTTAELARPARG